MTDLNDTFDASNVFATSAASFDVWAASAAALERSATVLWNVADEDLRRSHSPPWVFGPLMLLCALTVENLVKGLLVLKEPALNVHGEFAHRSHDLTVLVMRAGLDVTAEEADLLERLGTFLLWAGRYPIPLKHTNFATRRLETGQNVSTAYGTLSDRATWQDLLKKLSDRANMLSLAHRPLTDVAADAADS